MNIYVSDGFFSNDDWWLIIEENNDEENYDRVTIDGDDVENLHNIITDLIERRGLIQDGEEDREKLKREIKDLKNKKAKIKKEIENHLAKAAAQGLSIVEDERIK